MLTNLITYIAAILMGSLFSYFTLIDYLDNEEIGKNGIEKRVILLKRKQGHRTNTAEIRYKNKIYKYEGIAKGNIGDSISLLYHPKEDRFVKHRYKAYYGHIVFWIFFIACGIISLVHLGISHVKSSSVKQSRTVRNEVFAKNKKARQKKKKIIAKSKKANRKDKK